MSILIWAFLSLSVSVGFEVLEHDADARGQFEAQQGTSCAGSLGGSLLGTDGIHFLQGVAAWFGNDRSVASCSCWLPRSLA